MITTNSHYFICFFSFKFDSFSSSYTDFFVSTAGLILGITTTTAQWWRWHRTANATITNTRTTNGFVFSPCFFINQIYFKCFKTLRPSDSSCGNHDGDDERPPPQNTDGELERGSRFVFVCLTALNRHLDMATYHQNSSSRSLRSWDVTG